MVLDYGKGAKLPRFLGCNTRLQFVFVDDLLYQLVLITVVPPARIDLFPVVIVFVNSLAVLVDLRVTHFLLKNKAYHVALHPFADALSFALHDGTRTFLPVLCCATVTFDETLLCAKGEAFNVIALAVAV